MAEPQKQSAKGPLIALVGAACAAALIPTVTAWEGTELVPYKDVVGVWTVCVGDTYNVTPGKVATKAECDARLERQLIAHAKPIMECVPGLTRNRPNQLAAATSLAYNIGSSGFCRSTVARRFNAGRWREGCDAFLMWNKAGKKVVRGLTRRREAERQICLRGL